MRKLDALKPEMVDLESVRHSSRWRTCIVITFTMLLGDKCVVLSGTISPCTGLLHAAIAVIISIHFEEFSESVSLR